MKTLVCGIAITLVLGGVRAMAGDPPHAGGGEVQPGIGGWGPGSAWAQAPRKEGDRERRPEALRTPGLGRTMEEILFPPELVMRNQQAIGLREDQQAAIRAEVQKAVAKFTDLQWQQSAQVETLESLCGKQPVDEKAALAVFDKLLVTENEIKRLHFASLVRVKNVLSPEQQAQLHALERQGRSRGEDAPRRPDGGGADRQQR